MRWRESLERYCTARAILIAGYALFLVYAFPGYMSYDSVWQLAQARDLEPMNEWHPPLMAFMWGLLDKIVHGPLLMLLAQSTAFLFGLNGLLRRAMSDRAAALAAVIVMLLPQNIIVMAVIWKDSQMAGFLLASIACLLSDKRGWRIAGYGFVFLATGYRYNAAAATLPIIVLLWDRERRQPRVRRYATALALWLGITIAAVVASAPLVEQRKYPWHVGAAPVDLVGTIRFSPKMTDEEVLRATEGVPWLYKDKLWRRTRTIYSPMNTFLEVTQGTRPLIDYIGTPEYRAAIAKAWRTIVLAHPLAFLRHRVGVFGAQISTRAGVWYGFVDSHIGRDWLSYETSHSAIQLAWAQAMEKLAPTEVFRVRVYLLLVLLLFPFARRNRLALVLLISALLHEIGLFLIAPAIDYRYSHWMVISAIIALVLVVTDRARRSGTNGRGDRDRTDRPLGQ